MLNHSVVIAHSSAVRRATPHLSRGTCFTQPSPLAYLLAQNPILFSQIQVDHVRSLREHARQTQQHQLKRPTQIMHGPSLTDVESEVTGLVTYDRKVIKVDVDTVARANRGKFTLPEGVQE